ncbi:carboxymuconolactone decarboxylase family protein [Nocardiopsis suaedae]|uniref:Carboxymuconolactone decarboxylase family protein n=1 Tax=Nocardiopsis suaedae TaxID=3018444 RepID=A0ABT4TT55_9ACTN|nr:carboxymuconolactone decarboxylase family protein [Nocardiopsis suaedae]MDA2807439.1 carboxymuconolactone decarboxylase family protein [Nocardiopsis suaedae]
MDMRFADPMKAMPGMYEAIQPILKVIHQGGVPRKTLELVHLRGSQINGCSFCVNMGVEQLKQQGETDERLATVAAWAEAPYFTEAERAALELAEVATRLADHSGQAVPDEVWNAAAKHYDERQLGSLVLMIGLTNFFNRVNATVQIPAGTPMPA